MVRLQWLKLRAFRSFAEEARIDFPANGLLLIRGKNLSNQDPSGTGKSTIMLAVAYALDICPFPASELQSWLTDKDMQVQLGLETPQGEVVISRGKKNSIKIGDRTVTSAKAIAEELRNIFGLDSETLSAITYRAQNTKGLFLSLTDSEKKEFLTRLLGLVNIELAVDKAEERIKQLKPAMEAAEVNLAAFRKDLEGLQAQQFPEPEKDEALRAEFLELDRKRLELTKREFEIQEQAQGKKAKVKDDPELVRISTYINAAKAQYEVVLEAQQVREREFRANQEILRKKLMDIAQRDTMILNYRKELEQQKAQMAKLTAGHCPTCNRAWEDALAKAKALEGQIENLEATVGSLSRQQGDRQRLEAELRINFSADPNVEKLRTLKTQLEAQLQEKTQALLFASTEELQASLNAVKVELGAVHSRISGITQQLKMVQQVNEKLGQARAFAERNIAAIQAKIQAHETSTQSLSAELNSERDFVALMGREGFLGVIFDDVLKEIEAEANERLARLANVSHVTIQFKSEVVTGKGTIKRSITPVVSINGQEARLDSGLSGGMYTSVEGQVDLAVMAVVQRRTGSLPGFLFLDESFNGQGNVTKEATMEVLREYAQEKLVVVIDHNSEFKELFTQFIDVVYKDGRSEIA
jgi:DNA repair exonuclease SbcCD ATPase subunit